MTPPLPTGALEHLLKTLPPEREDPFPHLASLSTDQLLRWRVEITGQLKILEQERQAIDAELLEVFSDAELRMGIRAPSGWVLKQRSRTAGTIPLRFGMPSRVFSSRRNGMDGHSDWSAPISA